MSQGESASQLKVSTTGLLLVGLLFALVVGTTPGCAIKESDRMMGLQSMGETGFSSIVRIGSPETVLSSTEHPYLRQADFFVLSSDKAGLPMPLLEAIACGLPEVGTDVGGTGEVVVHEGTGLLVRRDSTGESARGIRYLLVDPVVRDSMETASRRRIGQHFDIDRAMNRRQSVIGA